MSVEEYPWTPQVGAQVFYEARSGGAPAIVTEVYEEDRTVDLTIFETGNISFAHQVPEGHGRYMWRYER